MLSKRTLPRSHTVHWPRPRRQPRAAWLGIGLIAAALSTGCSSATNDDAITTETPNPGFNIGRPDRQAATSSSAPAGSNTPQAALTPDPESPPEVGATTILADGRTITIDRSAEPSERPPVAAARRELKQRVPSPPGTDSAIAPAVVPADDSQSGTGPAVTTPAIGTSKLITLDQADAPQDGIAASTTTSTTAVADSPTTLAVAPSTTTTEAPTPPTTATPPPTTTLAETTSAGTVSETQLESMSGQGAASDAADQLVVEWDERGAPIPASDAAGLARQIILAESAIAVGADLVSMAHLQQVAYRTLSQRPEWDATVLAMVPRRHLAVVQAHLSARRSFLSLATRPSTLPSWRIVEPQPIDDLRAHYDEAESIFGVPAAHLAALHLVSSGFGRIVVPEGSGPQGPLQFLPETWEQWGRGDPTNDRHAILAAARLLRGKGWDTDPSAALFSFNDNPAYLDGVETYAALIEEHPEQLTALHAWQIYYLASSGDLWLPTGQVISGP